VQINDIREVPPEAVMINGNDLLHTAT
jgi:hypothetical protein